jgi:stage V sporulation protein G
MEITEVRIKLMEDSDDRLQGFCSVTFDNCFVVRDLKIIDGSSGPFVAMPSRKLTSHCQGCGTKNHLRAQYCNQCGARLREDRTMRDAEGRAKLYADVAHPINSACREMIQNRVIAEYRTELERAKQPGYVSRYEDEYDDDIDAASLMPDEEARPAMPTLPTGAQIQPAQSRPPPPHIQPGPQSQPGPPSAAEGSSTGGPHFTTPPPQREAAKEAKDAPGKSKPRDDFGAGIF